MLRKLRQSKWVTFSLFTALVAVFFCQHCEHETAHHEDDMVLAYADTCCEPVLCAEEEPEAHHDHRQCEFDEAHAHDFPTSSSVAYVPLVRTAEPMLFAEAIFSSAFTRASALDIPHPMSSPLLALSSIRLLI